jgi:hypothetical protein
MKLPRLHADVLTKSAPGGTSWRGKQVVPTTSALTVQAQVIQVIPAQCPAGPDQGVGACVTSRGVFNGLSCTACCALRDAISWTSAATGLQITC